MRTQKGVHVRACAQTHTHTNTHTHTHTTHAHTTHARTHTRMHNARTHARAHTHTCTKIHTQIHIHTANPYTHRPYRRARRRRAREKGFAWTSRTLEQMSALSEPSDLAKLETFEIRKTNSVASTCLIMLPFPEKKPCRDSGPEEVVITKGVSFAGGISKVCQFS